MDDNRIDGSKILTDDRANKRVDKDLPADHERREALVKLGKYAAYTAPAMLVTTNAKRAFAQAAPGTPVTTTTNTTTVTTNTTILN